MSNRSDRVPLVAYEQTNNDDSSTIHVYALSSEDIDEIAHARQIFTQMVGSGADLSVLFMSDQDILMNQRAALSLRYAYWFRKQQEQTFATRYAKSEEESK